MEINIDYERKKVEIWLTREETADAALRERLKPVFAACKQKKYFAAVFESGVGDLTGNTKYLLQANAEQAAREQILCGGEIPPMRAETGS